MFTTINNKLNNLNSVLPTPKKLSPYDNIKRTNNKNITIMNSTKKNIILKNITNKRISSDNIKKLYHIKDQEDKDSVYCLGVGGTGAVYMVSKLDNNSIIKGKQSNQLFRVPISKKKCNHYVLSVSKLGIIKEFLLNNDDYRNFNKYVEYAKEELEYNILMGVPAKLFIDQKNMILQLVSEYNGNILDGYIDYKPLNNNHYIDVTSGEIIAQQNLCYDLTRIITRQIIEKVLIFHNKAKCIHGDIKSSNILVNQLGEVTIIDFGSVIPMDSNDQIAVENFLGTYVFLPPEMFGAEKYVNGKYVDIYCIGLTLLYIMLKKEIFFIDEVKKNKFRFNYRRYNETIQEFTNNTDIPNDLKQIVLGMLVEKPKDRLSLEQAFNIISPQKLSDLSDLELEFEKQITMKRLVKLKKNKDILLQTNNELNDNEVLDIIDCSKDKSATSYNKEQKILEQHLKQINRIIENRTII
jgi:serine/threonine protein kinase